MHWNQTCVEALLMVDMIDLLCRFGADQTSVIVLNVPVNCILLLHIRLSGVTSYIIVHKFGVEVGNDTIHVDEDNKFAHKSVRECRQARFPLENGEKSIFGPES